MKPHGIMARMVKGLCLVLFLALSGCHHKAVTSAKTTPQSRLDWNLKTLVDAYDKNPDSSLNGDDFARAALTAFARMRANAFDVGEPLREIIGTNCDAAIQAGCDDPQVRYLYLRFSAAGQNLDAFTRAQKMQKIAEKMQQSNYPPIRKFYTHFRAVQELNAAYNYHFTNMPAESQAFITGNDLSVDINEALADQTIPVEEAYDACHELLLKTYSHDFYKKTYQSFETVFFDRCPRRS